jgi:hypothetical protein
MKKGIIAIVAILLCATVAFGITLPTEQAGSKIDKAMGNLPAVVDNLLSDGYSELLEGKRTTELTHSEGYRVHSLSADKISQMGENASSLDALQDEQGTTEWLYYLRAERTPVILVTMAEDGERITMKNAGGFAGCYAESRALLNSFAKNDKIRIFNYWYGQYVMTVEIKGQRFALPFDASRHLLKEYEGITDYRELPTEEEFLDALRNEYIWWEEQHQKYIEEHGEDAVLLGSFIVRPAAHIVK